MSNGDGEWEDEMGFIGDILHRGQVLLIKLFDESVGVDVG
jgi:hypothetical protein